MALIHQVGRRERVTELASNLKDYRHRSRVDKFALINRKQAGT